jgi:serine/threonine-protein kinase SRPK3
LLWIAVSADAGLKCEAQPVLLRAPEVILGHTSSTPVDIWSVGCLVRLTNVAPDVESSYSLQAFEYLVGTPLFQLRELYPATFADFHLAQIIEHIGPFPSDFLNTCSRRTEFFDDQGTC